MPPYLYTCCQIRSQIPYEFMRKDHTRAAHAKSRAMRNIIISISPKPSASNVMRLVRVYFVQKLNEKIELKMEVVVDADEPVVVVGNRVEISIELE